MRTPGAAVVGGRWGRSAIDRSLSEPLAAYGVAVFDCCTAVRQADEAARPGLPITRGGHLGSPHGMSDHARQTLVVEFVGQPVVGY